MNIISARDIRSNERGWKRKTRRGATILQLDVATREEIMLFADLRSRPTRAVVSPAFARYDIEVRFPPAVARRVCESCERGGADADEAGCDLGCAPENDLRLDVGYVPAVDGSDADD